MNMKQDYLLGVDIGSSSIKVSLLAVETGQVAGSVTAPKQEMPITSQQTGWAEQHPDMWWTLLVTATQQVMDLSGLKPESIRAIGITYQMHGLVAVDEAQQVIRPSIIWCDSRAASIGDEAFQALGSSYCLKHLLNSPGNFTASKLRWVQENEPELYRRIHKIMLPGDYIAMKMTGRISTTITGLSEGVFWDYSSAEPSSRLLDHFKISDSLLPEYHSSYEQSGELTRKAAEELGLNPGTPVSYRSGDQPNNAFSLNVLNPGEIAANAGTSGVLYGVTHHAAYDKQSRVNTFIHVTHRREHPAYGVLLCLNGTGILNSWLRRLMGMDRMPEYEEMNRMASDVPIGSDGLVILPFGNGSERILGNRNPGASLLNLDLNRHQPAHLTRAVQEGIVCALNYGLGIIRQTELKPTVVRAGHTNMFLSEVFRDIFVNTTGLPLELYNTDGSQGAARGAGLGAGIYSSPAEAFSGLEKFSELHPRPDRQEQYAEVYLRWREALRSTMESSTSD